MVTEEEFDGSRSGASPMRCQSVAESSIADGALWSARLRRGLDAQLGRGLVLVAAAPAVGVFESLLELEGLDLEFHLACDGCGGVADVCLP